MRCALALLLALAAAAPAFAAGRPMTVEDLLAVKAVSDPQVSPDGKHVVYVVSERDKATDKSNSDLWLVPLAGGEPRRLTTAPGADNHPRWSPDGQQIAFASSRGGSSQVWLLPIGGGEARQLTNLPIDVSGPIWSPKGDRIAFVAEVYPGKTPEETAAIDKEKADSRSKARVFDRLMIRHWDRWDEGKRSHLFVADAKTGEAKDLTPKLDVNTPPAPFGGSEDYAFSPDGKELAFTAEPLKNPAWSTNTDIWTVPVGGGELKNLTEANLAADAQPAYSPDGKWIAMASQERPGFEADQWVLRLIHRETGAVSDLTKAIDRPVLSFAWEGRSSEESRSLLAVVDEKGREPVYQFILDLRGDKASLMLDADRGISGLPKIAITGVVNSVRAVPNYDRDNEPSDKDRQFFSLVFVGASAESPGELFKARLTKNEKPEDKIASDVTIGKKGWSFEYAKISFHNDPQIRSLDLAKAESFVFEGADGDEVSGWLIRPPGFDEKKKYPILFLIHGGPQGAWHDEWHARWNYQLFTAPGYVVVAVNPRGSTGYGQSFTDQISKDWTGRVYEDLMKGLDFATTRYEFLDKDRVAAVGGSFGGFMVNWIAGHTDRFKALISHAGVFDLTSKYGTTEELWFPDWEFGGPPWEQSERYREQSPSNYVKNFKTPTLVIHGALDFRVPDAQGLGMFTALQRRGVPSRYLFFPDEGHWILKPANRVVWWREMHGWLAEYLDPKAP